MRTKSRDWRVTSTSQGLSRIIQELEEIRKSSPQEPSERAWSCPHLDVLETNTPTRHFMPYSVVPLGDFTQTSQLCWKVAIGAQEAFVVCPRKGQEEVHVTNINRAGTPALSPDSKSSHPSEAFKSNWYFSICFRGLESLFKHSRDLPSFPRAKRRNNLRLW